MLRFLARRLLWFAVTLFCVVTISFFMMRAVRGGPFDGERSLDPAIERNIEAKYHLDWPLWKQYLQYVGPLNLDEHRAELLGGDGTETAAIGERTGPGFSADEIVPAVERLVLAYLDLRNSRDETFLAAYRRLGAAPFKAALYPEAHANAA